MFFGLLVSAVGLLLSFGIWWRATRLRVSSISFRSVFNSLTTEHPWLTDEEKQFILANRLVNAKPKTVPYGQMLRSRQFWGIAISDMAFYWYINTSFVQMPTYLISMQGFTLADMGTLLAVAQLSAPFVAGPSSILADHLVNRGYRNKTVRRLIQVTVLVPGLVEQLWYVNHCNSALTVFIGE